MDGDGSTSGGRVDEAGGKTEEELSTGGSAGCMREAHENTRQIIDIIGYVSQ